MSTLDWALLLGYIFATISLGLWVARSSKTGKDVLLGGGGMSWFPVGISLLATSMSASTFLGLPAYAYAHNFALLLNQVGAMLATLIVAFVFIRRFRDANINSAYELLEQRFGSSTRYLGASFYCLHLLMRAGILVYGPALVLAPALGLSLEITVIIMAIVSTIYTAFGGLKAVVLTDTIQFLILCCGGGLTVWILHQEVGLSELWNIATMEGKTQILPDRQDLRGWIDPQLAHSVLSATLIYAVLELALRVGDQQFFQRYLACDSARSAICSSLLAMVISLPATLLFFCIGALLFSFYSIQSFEPLTNEAFPHFICHHIPNGLRGLLLAAIFSASMSSFDSAINALNHTTCIDLLRLNPDDPKSGTWARGLAVAWGGCAGFAGLLAAWGGKTLLIQALYFTSLFTGPLLALITMAFSNLIGLNARCYGEPVSAW